VLLSDDYNARVVSTERNVKAISIHKLLSLLIRRGRIDSTRAASHAAALHGQQRGQDYAEEELRTGRLGRVGQP
jgi:hypothetical protein